jgi:hypothetical protein
MSVEKLMLKKINQTRNPLMPRDALGRPLMFSLKSFKQIASQLPTGESKPLFTF